MTTHSWHSKPEPAREVERIVVREAPKTRNDPELAGDYINSLVEGLAVIIATSVDGDPKAIDTLADAASHRLFVRASACSPVIREASKSRNIA